MASWEDIKDQLEPLGKNFYTTPYHDIELSIAISLKRIADALTEKSMTTAEMFEKIHGYKP